METYYGNEHGMVLGPFAATEIGARMRAQTLLRTGWGSSSRDLQVYALKANSSEEALAKLAITLKSEKKES